MTLMNTIFPDGEKFSIIPSKHYHVLGMGSGCQSLSVHMTLEEFRQLSKVVTDYLISLEPDEPIHIPSDVAAPLEAKDQLGIPPEDDLTDKYRSEAKNGGSAA